MTDFAGDAGISTQCVSALYFQNDFIAMYQIILSCAEGYPPASQRTAFEEAVKIITTEFTEAGELAAATCSNDEDGELRYTALQMSSALHTIVQNNKLYSLSGSALMEGLQIGKCRVGKRRLPIVCFDVQQSVTSTLKIEAPSSSTRVIVEPDEYGDVYELSRKEFFPTIVEKF